jgi:hypothetical protein
MASYIARLKFLATLGGALAGPLAARALVINLKTAKALGLDEAWQ